jgi:hypothetical protein
MMVWRNDDVILTSTIVGHSGGSVWGSMGKRDVSVAIVTYITSLWVAEGRCPRNSHVMLWPTWSQGV